MSGGAASTGGSPVSTDPSLSILKELGRRVREGTPVDQVLEEMKAVLTVARSEPSSAPAAVTTPVKKSVLEMAVYHTAARTVSLVPKLEYNNYPAWHSKFTAHIMMIPGAVAHLEGHEHPAGFCPAGNGILAAPSTPGYDPKLDLAIGSMLSLTVGTNLDALMMRLKRSGGSGAAYLHQSLKAHVSRSDVTTQLAIQEELANLRQGNESIRKLGERLLKVFERAQNAGLELTESQQIVYLLMAVTDTYHSRRSNILDALDRKEPITFHPALEKFKQEEKMFNVSGRSDTSAQARAAQRDRETHSGKGHGGGGGAAAATAREKGAGPTCFQCGKRGHIKRNCPNKQAERHDVNKTHHEIKTHKADNNQDSFSKY